MCTYYLGPLRVASPLWVVGSFPSANCCTVRLSPLLAVLFSYSHTVHFLLQSPMMMMIIIIICIFCAFCPSLPESFLPNLIAFVSQFVSFSLLPRVLSSVGVCLFSLFSPTSIRFFSAGNKHFACWCCVPCVQHYRKSLKLFFIIRIIFS